MSRWICIDNICIPSDENDWDELVAFANAIAEQEPIDLVHCRECKFWSENTQFCHMFSTRFTAMRMLPNDFCSLGVKKENE